jgi:hypothetical protein
MKTLKNQLLDLKDKFDIPMSIADSEDSEMLKNLYNSSSTLDSLCLCWFSEDFLLDMKDGKYFGKYQEYDENGYPTDETMNSCYFIGSIKTISTDKQDLPGLSNNGLLQIGCTESGDYLVIDLYKEDTTVGLVEHELLWSGNKSYRECFKKLCTFSVFLDMILNDKVFPREYL